MLWLCEVPLLLRFQKPEKDEIITALQASVFNARADAREKQLRSSRSIEAKRGSPG